MHIVRSTVLTGPAVLLSCARDVDYYHCDVVGAAVALGEAREFGSGLLRAGGGLQNGAHRRFADMGRQPVGTQQQPGAGEDRGRLMSGSIVAAMPMARVSRWRCGCCRH